MPMTNCKFIKEINMSHYLRSLFTAALTFAIFMDAWAVETIPITTQTIAQHTFKPKCMENGCGIDPKSLIPPKKWCMVASKFKCIPLESNKVSGIFPKPNTLHWRVYPNGKMAQFKGDIQITPLIATQMPLVDAKPDQVKAFPIIGLGEPENATVYWVKTKLPK
jgi:hypothetical protein